MKKTKKTEWLGALALIWSLAGCNLGDEAPPLEATCGDGEVQAPEACDDGNADGDDYCSETCDAVTGFCGDGTTQENEACDDGNTNDGDYCSSDCQAETAVCGDGNVGPGEACDDSNTDDGDYCSADCQTVSGSCGDGDVQANEVCDDGNTEDDDYCSPDCQTQDGFCGDAIKQDFEGCDDGNTDAGDYCAPDCSAFTGRCNDGVVQDNEACDDGNNDDGDYCAGDCQESFGACGDDVVQAFEVCDDGNADDGDYCAGDCQAVTGACGDAEVQPNEACDDGDTEDGDYCSADCTAVTGECGDGALQEGEECDDANDIDDDLCTSACTRNPFRYEQDVTIDTPTTWPAGVDITFAGATTLTVESELTISEGVLLQMGSNSTILVEPGGSLLVEGTEGYPVTIDSSEQVTRCGSHDGITVDEGTLLARHLVYQRATAGISARDSSVTLEDTVLMTICAEGNISNGPGRSITALTVLRGEATLRRVTVDDINASVAVGNGSFAGGSATGILLDKAAVRALEDLTIQNLNATAGSRGGEQLGIPGFPGGDGGDGGAARGLVVQNRPDAEASAFPLVVERVFVDALSAGAGGDGGRGANGRAGAAGTDRSRDGGPGQDGGSGGDGGASGAALGVAITDTGEVTLRNVMVTRVEGASPGDGGRGGNGGQGGAGFFGGFGSFGSGGNGGDAGGGGTSGRPGNVAGIDASALSLVVEHATVRGITSGGLGQGASGGAAGQGGSGFPAGTPGRVTLPGAVLGFEQEPACVSVGTHGDGAMTVDPIVRFSVLVGSPTVYGLAALAGAMVVSDYNLFDGLLDLYLDVTAGANDIVAEPLFVNATSRDFTPSTASPLFNAATGSTATLDVFGNPRDATPDIGAIENVAAP